MKVYGDSLSGNCYKIQLLLALLGKKCDWIEMSILNGDTQSDEFKAKNPLGKIPLLELSDGRFISESNAILHYLASGSTLIPSNLYDQSIMLQWQFFEQYSHEPYIAVARFINLYLGLPESRLDEYQQKQAGGHKALTVMENHLSTSAYFVGNKLSLADISLYAYTHVAHEGGFDLSEYPSIKNWLRLIESERGFMPMKRD